MIMKMTNFDTYHDTLTCNTTSHNHIVVGTGGGWPLVRGGDEGVDP